MQEPNAWGEKCWGRPLFEKRASRKVTGQSKYVDDLEFPGMIYGTTVRSQTARGKIKKIHFEGSYPLERVHHRHGEGYSGKELRRPHSLRDQPFLADKQFNHPEEPVVLLAHPDKYLLEEARRNVRIETEELPTVFTIDDALEKKEIIWGDDNVFKSYLVDKGDVDTVWEKAEHIVEGEYFTGAQEQLYIENNGMIAVANPNEGVTVWGSMQCPYYIHKALLPLFGLPEDKILQ